jgi:hypothetical protein
MSLDQWVVTVAGAALAAGVLVYFFGRRAAKADDARRKPHGSSSPLAPRSDHGPVGASRA